MFILGSVVIAQVSAQQSEASFSSQQRPRETAEVSAEPEEEQDPPAEPQTFKEKFLDKLKACPSCPAQSAPWRPARKTQVLFFGKRVAGCTSGACTLGSHQPEHLAVNRSASAHSADRQFRATDTRYKIPGHHRVRSLCLSDF